VLTNSGLISFEKGNNIIFLSIKSLIIVEVVRGCSGDVEELVAAYLSGDIKDNGETCDHHECH
jgi:hypothetical protein